MSSILSGGLIFLWAFGEVYQYCAGVPAVRFTACADKLKSNPIGVFKVAQAVQLPCPAGLAGIRKPMGGSSLFILILA